MRRFPGEVKFIEQQGQRIDALKANFDTRPAPTGESSTADWLTYLLEMKRLLGHTHNAATTVATMLARDYLTRALPMRPFDATAKKAGKSGLDIDDVTLDGSRVIAEIKTTTPYGDMGANQKKALEKDLGCLSQATAEFKFFFVTDASTYSFVTSKYAHLHPDVSIKLLIPEEGQDA